MEKEVVEYFRNLLLSQLEELLSEGKRTIVSIQEHEGTSFADPVEQAFVDQHLNMKFRIKDRESKLIKKIREALARIDDGTFGICEICEDEISTARLKARPVTTQCIECKQRGEQWERITEQKAQMQ
ncbi:MAG: RNA polymerase-binding protein DksA [Proteobacteria bacterium]|nr:RNA polymerase-binding protein DksA [Pseudomonadota bacterium]